jgi:hypothetical protein
MSAPPLELPEWGTAGGAQITAPSLGFRQLGYEPSTPAGAGVMNWWKKLTYEWVKWLKVDGACAQREASAILETSAAGAFPGGADQFRGFASTPQGVIVGVGDGGRIYTSTNGGASWTARTAAGGYTGAFADVQYINGADLLAIGAGGMIQASSLGTTWFVRSSGTSEDLACLGSDGSGRLIVAGANGVTRVSTDDGITWVAGGTVNSGNFAARSICFANGVWLLGGNSSPTNRDTTLFRSTDNGATWVPIVLSSGPLLGVSEYSLGVAAVQGVFVAHIAGGATQRTIVSLNGLQWLSGGTCTTSDAMMLAVGTHVVALAPKETNKPGVVSYDCGATWVKFFQPGFGSASRVQMMYYNNFTSLGTRKWMACGTNGTTHDDRGQAFYSRYFAI